MEIRDYLSDDGQAVLTLCSALALPKEGNADAPEPLKLSEWNQLARQIQKWTANQTAVLQDNQPHRFKVWIVG